MLGLIGASLGGLAKKVLKDRAVKIGKAVYERTLKPVIMKLRDKAIELTRRVATNPLDTDLGARLDEVEADIRTLERAEAKLPVESMGTTEQSRAKSRVEDAELDQRFKTKPTSGYDADKALIDAKTRAKGRVVGGRPSTIDFGSGYKESYAMKPTQSLQARLPSALESIGGITEESMFGVELAPIKDALEIQEENLLEARLFNSGRSCTRTVSPSGWRCSRFPGRPRGAGWATGWSGQCTGRRKPRWMTVVASWDQKRYWRSRSE